MYRNRQKKGLSTIVASIFMISIIAVGLNVITTGLSSQNNFGQVLTEKHLREAEAANEKIAMRDVKISNNKFNITMVNTGTIPVKLVKMWVTNDTCTTATCITANWHPNYDLTNKLINPGDSLANLGQDLSLVAKNSSSYKINLVTERGSSASFQILSPKDKAIKMSLFAFPRSIPTGQNVTVLFSVTNNLTDGSILQSIRPKLPLSWTTTETPGGTTPATATLIEGPTPAAEPSLTLAETSFFKWVYKITGDEGDRIKFNATVVDAKQGNYVTEIVDVVVVANASYVVSQIATTTGILTMNFTSFQFCEPATKDCRSNSNDWKPGWEANDNAAYLWRVNVANNGPNDIFLSKNTAVLLLHVQTAGGGNMPTAMYIKDDSTTTNEDPAGGYSDYSKNLKADGQYYTVYFGVTTAGGTTLQTIGSEGMYTVNIVLFGYADANNNHTYESTIDTTPYSQNLPFQGLYIS